MRNRFFAILKKVLFVVGMYEFARWVHRKYYKIWFWLKYEGVSMYRCVIKGKEIKFHTNDNYSKHIFFQDMIVVKFMRRW